MLTDLVTTTAALSGAALGGLYLAFDLAVLPALRRVPVGGPAGPESPDGPDGPGGPAETMRAINVAIVRPAFLALLFGAPALAVTAAVVHPTPGTVAGAALQVGALVVTLAVNVPLNDRLAAGGPWAAFVGPWLRAHRVRTAAALLGAVLVLV